MAEGLMVFPFRMGSELCSRRSSGRVFNYRVCHWEYVCAITRPMGVGGVCRGNGRLRSGNGFYLSNSNSNASMSVSKCYRCVVRRRSSREKSDILRRYFIINMGSSGPVVAGRYSSCR